MAQANYRGAFFLGILLIALGSSFISLLKGTAAGPVFIGIGALFMLFGARHKDKWRTPNNDDANDETAETSIDS